MDRPTTGVPQQDVSAVAGGPGLGTVAPRHVRRGEQDLGHFGPERNALARRTGLLLPTQLSVTAWQRIGHHMHVISDSSAWWWGDWLVFGEDRYPDRYRQAISETSLDYQTLRNYAWVARRFPMSRRRERLSFQHHVVVAALPVAEQERWLSLAEDNSWSRNELRRQLRQTRSEATPARDVVYQLKVDRERQDRWERASVRADTDLADWIVVALDRAADAVLSDQEPVPAAGA